MERIVPLLSWVENSTLAVAIAQSNWAFPAIETIHVLGLTLTIGTVLIIDLRLLGLASVTQPYDVLRRDVLPLIRVAFGLAVISGSLMFVSQATVYFANSAFRIKFALLLLAGLNMLVLERFIAKDAANPGRPIRWPAKAAALLSIALWIGVVFFGRRIGFTMTPFG